MKFAEKVFAIMILTGTLFWFMYLPFSSMLKFIGGTLLVMLYFLFGFALLNGVGIKRLFSKSSYDGSSDMILDEESNEENLVENDQKPEGLSSRLLPAVLGSLGLAISTGGMVFYLLLWPGSLNLRMMGAGMLILVGLLIYLGRATSGGLWYRFWTRALPWGAAILLTLALPKHILLDMKYGDDQTYLEAYKNYLDHPDSQKAFNNWLEEDKRKYPEAYDYIE